MKRRINGKHSSAVAASRHKVSTGHQPSPALLRMAGTRYA